jgi:hypothetical protein
MARPGRRLLSRARVETTFGPEPFIKNWSKDRRVDRDESDNGLTDTPAVYIQARGCRSERQHRAYDGCRDDEKPGAKQYADNELFGESHLELPEHGDGNRKNHGIGHDVEDSAHVEVLRLKGACARRKWPDLPVV